jgi:hypothetical protein
MTVTRLYLLSTLCVCMAVAGCSSTERYALTGADLAPGADAILEVRPQGDVREMRLEVTNLLPPDRVRAGATHYAVWVRLADRPPVHLGNLTYDEKTRAGKLSATTPYTNFELTVRPEALPHPAAPANEIVLIQQVRGD